MNPEIYKEEILDHYRCPRNKKELNPCTKKCKQLNLLCGDEIYLYLNIENKIIKEATFTGVGCALSQAAVSMLTERLINLPVEEAKKVTEEDVLEMLKIPISQGRMKCVLLSLKALQKLLEEK